MRRDRGESSSFSMALDEYRVYLKRRAEAEELRKAHEEVRVRVCVRVYVCAYCSVDTPPPDKPVPYCSTTRLIVVSLLVTLVCLVSLC